MEINKIKAMYFSPNGSTKEIINLIAEGVGIYDIEDIDLTTLELRKQKIEFQEDELLIIGLPVYADRLPTISDEIFKNIKGSNTPAVIVVSYGNRDYGDALLELKDNLAKIGFKIISGAAAIGEHCLNTNVAKGRPDEEDKIKIKNFASKVSKKINKIHNIEEIEDISIKGKHPYRPLKSQRTPVGDDKCIQCGICEQNCPVDAISKEDFRKTDNEMCIFCGRCIQVCPTDARDIRDESFLNFMGKLEIITSERRELEAFF